MIKQAQSGNSEAFGKLYVRYFKCIYRYIFFRVGRNQQTAEDLTHDVFMKTWKNIVQFHTNTSNFRAWVYKIAHNRVIDFYKADFKTIRLDALPQEPRMEDFSYDELFKKQEIAVLLKAFEYVTDEQKDVLLFRFVEDLSYREIAEIMNKTDQAVRALQSRALKTLRERMVL